MGHGAWGWRSIPRWSRRAPRARDGSGWPTSSTFRQQDLFEADLTPATVVTLYLSPGLNRRLRPKLLRELRPGARIVSHSFDMGDWAPARTLQVSSHEGSHTLYLWVAPGK